jgi:uncharacterized protein YaaN involved in tellurite resistance
MTNESNQQNTAVDTAVTFQLTPPEVITPVTQAIAKTAVPLSAETKKAVNAQVEQFVNGLMQEDLHSETFKAKLDSAFALGKQEVSVAASMMQGRFMSQNFVGVEDQSAFKAISQMRGHLDELNPGKEGDLFGPNKILGIPFGNKLQAYFRKYQSASEQLNQSMQQLYLARDDMQRDVVEIEATRTKLWDGMQKLGGAILFAEQLDAMLVDRVAQLQSTDPERAKALQQEVLFYTRQNLADMLTQQSVCTNGYMALDVLKKTGREMMNGCTRVATTGMSALAVAQTVARATGNQIQVMDMLKGVNSTVEALVVESGRQLGNHVDVTTQFASNPMIGVEKIREMFDQTFKAMDAMDTFRAKAIDVMGQNNKIMKEQLEKAQTYVDRTRAQQAKTALSTSISGPVAL